MKPEYLREVKPRGLRGKLPEGSDGVFVFIHLVAIAFGASNNDLVVPGIAIASLMIGSILGREPKRNGLGRAEWKIWQQRIAARERRLIRESVIGLYGERGFSEEGAERVPLPNEAREWDHLMY